MSLARPASGAVTGSVYPRPCAPPAAGTSTMASAPYATDAIASGTAREGAP
ncbi:hypothetical protein [Streptomyces sp. Ag109_O5-1]|uniref:hypothetical protein n=1 Tax=Streptomyces sp. Ag109_O5-1 TaxID=1938851 RepID=UPI0016243BE1|nr:hypothetical protein [Streptomyces sp. Ag109_O5-1]